MIVYWISLFVAWLYGTTEPISDWVLAPLLQMLSWVETAIEGFVLIVVMSRIATNIFKTHSPLSDGHGVMSPRRNAQR